MAPDNLLLGEGWRIVRSLLPFAQCGAVWACRLLDAVILPFQVSLLLLPTAKLLLLWWMVMGLQQASVRPLSLPPCQCRRLFRYTLECLHSENLTLLENKWKA